MPSVPADPNDLIDPEAPAAGGAKVDTKAYAAPRSPAAEPFPSGAPDPPPSPARSVGSDDPYVGASMDSPPQAGPELGGGAAALQADVVEAGVDALLDLCADRAWRDIALREVAARAGVSFAALYARAPGKAALLSRLSDRYDREALRAVDGDPQPQAHDRLFEAFMARLEAMAARRDALIAIARADPLLATRRIGRTARALAEASGVDTTGGRGALRLAALTGVWARTLQVWRDDEGALNRTMAEIDTRLRQAARRLERVGAGF